LNLSSVSDAKFEHLTKCQKANIHKLSAMLTSSNHPLVCLKTQKMETVLSGIEFTKPLALLGPHAAPLGMRFYTGNMFPGGISRCDPDRPPRLVEPDEEVRRRHRDREAEQFSQWPP
jgi:hypothetical protein